MIIADTSGLLAFFNRREPAHDPIRDIVEREPEPLVVSPYVVAEILDHRHFAVLRPLDGGRFRLLP